jgi:hypothetical protein
LRSDTYLASEFTAKLTEARSIPEAMSASQEWATPRLQMMAEDGQQLAAVIQKLAETSARFWAPHELVMRILKLRWIGTSVLSGAMRCSAVSIFSASFSKPRG